MWKNVRNEFDETIRWKYERGVGYCEQNFTTYLLSDVFSYLLLDSKEIISYVS